MFDFMAPSEHIHISIHLLEEWVHVIVEAEKTRDLSPASGRPMWSRGS